MWGLFWGKPGHPGVVPVALDKIRANKDCMEKACRSRRSEFIRCICSRDWNTLSPLISHLRLFGSESALPTLNCKQMFQAYDARMRVRIFGSSFSSTIYSSTFVVLPLSVNNQCENVGLRLAHDLPCTLLNSVHALSRTHTCFYFPPPFVHSENGYVVSTNS